MKKASEMVIVCEYSNNEKSLWSLIEECFRLYLMRKSAV